MFNKNKIRTNLLNHLRTLQLNIINPDTANIYRHEALKEMNILRYRIDLLYMRYKLSVYSIYGNEILFLISCKSSYDSSNYFFDIVNYQLGKVMKDFHITKTEITHDGYKSIYKINKKDIEIFKFTIKDITNQLKNGTWLIDSKHEDKNKYISYVRLDTRAEFLI